MDNVSHSGNTLDAVKHSGNKDALEKKKDCKIIQRQSRVENVIQHFKQKLNTSWPNLDSITKIAFFGG